MKSRHGIFFLCRKCNGRLVSIPVLKKEDPASLIINGLWQAAKDNGPDGGRTCPHCGRPMPAVKSGIPGRPVTLDVCILCSCVWFDSREYEGLPRSGPLPVVLSREERKDIDIDLLNRRYNQAAREDLENDFALLLASFGLPAEDNDAVVNVRPWATWSMAAVCILIFLVSLFNMDAAFGVFGFIPSEWGRMAGVTLLSSFFIHASVLQLIGNMYFLLVFGDNVEDMVGKAGFVFLLFSAHLAGMVLHGLLGGGGSVPFVGAGAGIFGVLTYYALAFPHARIGALVFFHWLKLPVFVYFLIWILFQAFLSARQAGGALTVSILAFLGGIGAGALWFFLFPKKEPADL